MEYKLDFIKYKLDFMLYSLMSRVMLSYDASYATV